MTAGPSAAALDLDALGAALAGDARLYLEPLGLAGGPSAEALCTADLARPLGGSLAGPRLAWTACRVWLRRGARLGCAVARPSELTGWVERLPPLHRARLALWLERSAQDKAVPGMEALGRPAVMGIVNVTPDSFSDGGEALDPADALHRIEALIEAGADLIDIGAVSTQPGAEAVAEAEELRRLAPLLDAVAREGVGDRVPLSIDTSRAATMRAALDAGFALINDVSALAGDPGSLPLLAKRQAPAVLMHGAAGAGTAVPADCAALDLFDALEDRITACEAAGLARAKLVVDPGIAFGKSGAENLAILERLSLLQGLGCPLLLGVSRKGLTGALDRRYGPRERLPGSLAAALRALDRGAQMLRVHDVAETRQAVEVWRLLAVGADTGDDGRAGQALP